jgi:hypothetical protein
VDKFYRLENKKPYNFKEQLTLEEQLRLINIASRGKIWFQLYIFV